MNYLIIKRLVRNHINNVMQKLVLKGIHKQLLNAFVRERLNKHLKEYEIFMFKKPW